MGVVLAVGGVLAGVIVAIVAGRGSRGLDCVTASRAAPAGVVVSICQREYEQTKRPIIGAYLADALRRSNNVEGAKALANDLLSTEARADAFQILGKIAIREKRVDDAVRDFQEARQLHRQQGNRIELARDNQALAEIQTRREQYAEALQTLDECIAESSAVADKQTQGYCHLTAARVLTYVGYFEAAQQELDRAAQQLSADGDLAQLWTERGNLEQEVDRGSLRRRHHAQAVAAFERALELATRAQVTKLVRGAHLNLAFSLAELGRFEDADRHLAEGGVLDRDGDYAVARGQLAARIAYRRGNHSLALSLNERLYPEIEDEDEKIDVCVMQARIALARNDLAAAALWARRGVEIAEKVRGAQSLAELRPWVLARRREPFEVLFTALARGGRLEDAIIVFDQWQGRTLLDAMARPSPAPSPGLSSTAAKVQSLGRWLPAVSKAPLMANDRGAVLQPLGKGKIDLIALVVAEGDLWRLTASGGRLRLDPLGSFEALRDRLDRFTAAPTDPARADELGALFLPDDLVRKTDEPLHVVLDAPLAGLPFVALRRNGQPLIAVRPVLRAPRLPGATPCPPRAGIRSALVLADAAGDLPAARRESSRVASMFGTTPLVGPAATSEALFAAKSAPLLHVAVHADIDAGGGSLKLFDRAVLAPQISASKLGPPLVVLAGCSTATSWDPEVAGSLSTAFLAAGSTQVVATLRRVSDTGALELTSRFYDASGPDDPVRVLAKIQAELARTDHKEWPLFAVFGNGVCTPGS